MENIPWRLLLKGFLGGCLSVLLFYLVLLVVAPLGGRDYGSLILTGRLLGTGILIYCLVITLLITRRQFYVALGLFLVLVVLSVWALVAGVELSSLGSEILKTL